MTPTATKMSSDVTRLGKGQVSGGELSELLVTSSTLRAALEPATRLAGQVFSSSERFRIGDESELARAGSTWPDIGRTKIR